MKIGVATTFLDLKPSYSLATVVTNQLKALVDHGYETVLLALPPFDATGVPEGVEIRRVIPQIYLEPYGGRDPKKIDQQDVSRDIEVIFHAMEQHMTDLDVIITHDWMLVDTFAPYAAALQLVPQSEILSKKKWLHWIHSHPARYEYFEYPWSAQFEIPAGHKIVYLNNADIISVAERYQGTLDDVRVVHNPTDPRTFFNLHPLTKIMIDGLGLLDADIMQVYPVSTPRMVENKQVDKIIRLLSHLKGLGKKVKLVVCNAHANGEKEKQLIREIIDYGWKLGLTKDELIFTSLINVPEWEHGVPHDVVRDLFLISNLFIFPTTSENCPLILLEAAAAKNLLVLNDDFPPLKEFFGSDALYFKFGSVRVKTQYLDENQYYQDMAKIIASELGKNRNLKSFTTLKQKFNYDYIFTNEFEPILFEERKPNGLPDESRNED